MTYSAEQLIRIVEQYWPSNRETYLRPDTSQPFARFQERWSHALVHGEQWQAFRGELKETLSDFVIGDATSTFDASRRCAVYPREADQPPHLDWAVVGCVSILAPVYTVYAVQYELSGGKRSGHQLLFGVLPSEMQGIAMEISRKIEAVFGFQALAREIAETPIPLFVDPQHPPKTTLFHALFTSQPESLP